MDIQSAWRSMVALGRLSLSGFIVGCWAVHQLAGLPGWRVVLALWVGAAGAGWLVHRMAGVRAGWLLPVLCLLTGFGYTALRAEYRLSDALADHHVDQVARVRLRVASLPVLDQAGWRFDAPVVSSRPAGVPARIRVRWSEPVWRGPYAHPDPDRSQLPLVPPGQLWRMALVLKPVHGPRNPGLRPRRTVSEASNRVQRWSHQIHQPRQPFLNDHEDGRVLLALSLGEQGTTAQRQWEVFRKPRLAHLDPISGTHVSLIADL